MGTSSRSKVGGGVAGLFYGDAQHMRIIPDQYLCRVLNFLEHAKTGSDKGYLSRISARIIEIGSCAFPLYFKTFKANVITN